MKKNYCLLILIICALIVRVVGINYGLPFLYHDDEPIIVNYALAYGSGDFNPHFFNISPSLSYILFFCYGIWFVLGKLLGAFKNISDFAYLYLNNPTAFYLTGRILFGLICGTSSVAAIYALGRKYFSKTAGLVSAFLLGFCFLHVRDSHYLYFDVPLTLFVIIFFIKLFDVFETKRRKDYVLIGIFFALAASIKYSGFFLAFPLALAVIYNLFSVRQRTWKNKFFDIFYMVLCASATLFIFNPFSFIEYKEFLRSVSNLPAIPTPFSFHLTVSLINGVGGLITLFALFSMFLAIMRRQFKLIVIAAYMVFFYWVLQKAGQPAERLIMPLVPLVIIFCAALIVSIAQSTKSKAASRTIIIVVTLLVSFPSLVKVYYVDKLFLQTDTRTLAYQWIKYNIKKDSRIALDAMASWFPRLEKNKEQIKGLQEAHTNTTFEKPNKAAGIKQKFLLENPYYPEITYYIFYLKEKEGIGRGFVSMHPDLTFDINELRRNNIKYVVLSRVLSDESYKGFVNQVGAGYKLIKVFTPYKDKYKAVPEEFSLPPAAAFTLQELITRNRFGPVIKIYEVKR